MYMIYNIDKIHHLCNESKRSNSLNNKEVKNFL